MARDGLSQFHIDIDTLGVSEFVTLHTSIDGHHSYCGGQFLGHPRTVFGARSVWDALHHRGSCLAKHWRWIPRHSFHNSFPAVHTCFECGSHGPSRLFGRIPFVGLLGHTRLFACEGCFIVTFLFSWNGNQWFFLRCVFVFFLWLSVGFRFPDFASARRACWAGCWWRCCPSS